MTARLDTAVPARRVDLGARVRQGFSWTGSPGDRGTPNLWDRRGLPLFAFARKILKLNRESPFLMRGRTICARFAWKVRRARVRVRA